jgi:hypothetical protein
LRWQTAPPTAQKTDTDKLAICAGQASGGRQPIVQRQRCLPSAASSRTAPSALRASWIGLCRIAIYQVVKEQNGGQGRLLYVTPVHVKGFGGVARFGGIFCACRQRFIHGLMATELIESTRVNDGYHFHSIGPNLIGRANDLVKRFNLLGWMFPHVGFKMFRN